MPDNEEESQEENTTNKADDYTGYWPDDVAANENTYVISSDKPEFHCYISFQKEGTETEAEHYEDQDNPTANDNTPTATVDDNSTSTESTDTG